MILKLKEEVVGDLARISNDRKAITVARATDITDMSAKATVEP